VYFIHGGGFVSGDERGAGLAAELERAEAVGAAAVSVRFRLAPEHRYPAALEYCFAGLVWLTGRARELGVDPAQIVVSGPSTGGGLAAGMRLLARERGGPSLLGQMLQQPMLDDRCDTSSAAQMDGLAGTWTGRQALPAGQHCSANCVARTQSRRWPHAQAHAPRIYPASRPPTSTSDPLTVFVTKPSPTPTRYGAPEDKPNCTYGPAATTASTSGSPMPS
jgi:acetyl esterase/lipase